MVQQHIFDAVECEVDSRPREDAVLRFDPVKAVRAIVFHLVDGDLANAVSPDTIDRTVERLIVNAISPSIARRRWESMTNSQRLRWLLNECHTTTRIGVNGIVRLRAKHGTVSIAS